MSQDTWAKTKQKTSLRGTHHNRSSGFEKMTKTDPQIQHFDKMWFLSSQDTWKKNAPARNAPQETPWSWNKIIKYSLEIHWFYKLWPCLSQDTWTAKTTPPRGTHHNRLHIWGKKPYPRTLFKNPIQDDWIFYRDPINIPYGYTFGIRFLFWNRSSILK